MIGFISISREVSLKIRHSGYGFNGSAIKIHRSTMKHNRDKAENMHFFPDITGMERFTVHQSYTLVVIQTSDTNTHITVLCHVTTLVSNVI